MYYSSIGILAILILLIENADILLSRSDAFAKPYWKAYQRFLLAILVYYVTDVLWGILESHGLAALLFADTTAHFMAMATGVLCWTTFAVVYLDERNGFSRFLMAAGRVLAGTVTILSCVNIATPILFTVDERCVYHALAARYAIIICQIVLLLLISAHAAASIPRHTDEQPRRARYRTLMLFGMIMVFFLFAQLWYPYLPIYTVAYLLGTCLLRAVVIADEKEEYRRGLMEAAKIGELKQSITALMDNMPALCFSKDAQTGVHLACNQAFAEYARKEGPEGVVGLTDGEIFDPATAEHFVEDDRMALSMEEPYTVFEEVPDPAGNHRQLQTTKLKFIDAAGRLCTLGMSQDVTDMVRIQRENATTLEAYEKARSAAIISTHIAQTLAHGYEDVYYVNLETEEYIEYRTESEFAELTEARRGGHFFDSCKLEANLYVHPDDREAFVKAMGRETLIDALSRNGTFTMTYRLIGEQGPTYVSMRVSRMSDDDRFLVIGVSDVDEQMRQRHANERLREERIAYARLNALTGNFLFVYVVAPETGRYREYSSSPQYERYALPPEGTDFFGALRAHAPGNVYQEDLSRYLSLTTRDAMLSEIATGDIFVLTYRILIEGRPIFLQLKAAIVEEADGSRLIVGVNDIDAQVRQEEEYSRRLAQAQNKANVDALTGVKNKHAYLEVEEHLDRQIEEHHYPEFAIIILDVNDLKAVNDTAGHQAGDQYIRDACKTICATFKRSPVYRVGGDEFAVIARGDDYERIDELMDRLRDHNREAQRTHDVVIACGMAKFADDPCVATVYNRADLRMYKNKSDMKEGRLP